jgi:putative phage-type endonuclease
MSLFHNNTQTIIKKNKSDTPIKKKTHIDKTNDILIEHLSGLEKTYNLTEFDELIDTLHKKIKEKFDYKKVRKFACKYVKFKNGRIYFDTEEQSNMNYKIIRKILEESKIITSKITKTIKNKPTISTVSLFHTNEGESDEHTDDEDDEDIYDGKNENYYSYPTQSEFKFTKKTGEKYEPTSTQWIHDIQEDDKLDKEAERKTKLVKKLSKLKFFAQKSKGWHKLRYERATASDGGTIVGVNKHEPQYKFLVKKVRRPPFESNRFCHHGTKYEQIATMTYEYRMNVKVEEFGLVKHHDPKYYFLAASPDGIISKYKLDGKSLTKYVGRMLEIKCPLVRKILDEGEVKGEICPIYYWVQVQLQLECCDLDECDFWQCELWEYEDKEEFIRDTNLEEPFRSKSTGMEKGCVIQLLPKKRYESINNGKYWDVVYGESKYIYPPKIEMSPYDYDIWIANVMTNFSNESNKQNIRCDVCMEKYNELDCDCEIKKCGCIKPNVVCDCYYVDKILYWKVAKAKCNTINRDKEWFSENLPKLDEMWKYVEYFRKNEEKSNIFFDYIEYLPFKNNQKIMEIAKRIYNEPDINDSVSVKEYAKFLNKIKEDQMANKNKYDDSRKKYSESTELLKKEMEKYKYIYEESKKMYENAIKMEDDEDD